MKNIMFLFPFLFCGFSIFSQNQNKPDVDDTSFWYVNDFENYIEYINIDTSAQNIWQIGPPQKTIFNTALSSPNVIITDTLDNYPANNYSYFDVYIGEFNFLSSIYYWDVVIDFWHKFDTDTLKDGGYITVSWDKGLTWINVINDTIYPYDEMPGNWSPFTSNLYTNDNALYNGECGFSGNSNGWVRTFLTWFHYPRKKNFPPDTMIIRFNFISDSIDNPKEGWMIDNLRLFSIDLGSGVNDYKNDEVMVVSPNPFNATTLLSFDKTYEKIEITIYDKLGKLFSSNAFFQSNRIVLNRNSKAAGLYFLKVTINDKFVQTKKILIN